jgi:PhzF family phenazine biosynthesis protein
MPARTHRSEHDGAISYHLVDVFSDAPYSGNSLAVFVDPPRLSADQMLAITQELRHFESIFLTRPGDPAADRRVFARVFDLLGELEFAGHPLLGAAAVLHHVDSIGDADRPEADGRDWSIALDHDRVVEVHTRRATPTAVSAVMDQGRPQWLTPRNLPGSEDIAAAVGLAVDDLDAGLPPAVVSTGLRYLLVPVLPDALGRARISRTDFADFLGSLGAEFVYVLSAPTDGRPIEGRHWTNDGSLEDVATGSAAGCVAAYLRRHARIGDGDQVELHQGRHVGRPSRISIRAFGPPEAVDHVVVGGDVTLVGCGRLDHLPPAGVR